MGMRPDLTGRGHGRRYLAAVIDHATRVHGATQLRATVAELNARALRMCERAGFVRVERFDRTPSPERPALPFWILVR
jgi:RimJ/RimL family protein N-acetyltransferase